MSERPSGSSGPADGAPSTTNPSPDAWVAGPAPRPSAPPTDGDGSRSSRGSARDDRPRGVLGFLLELPVLVILAFALALLIKTLLVQAFYIPSESMLPALAPGDRVLVNKLAYRFGDVRRGDIVVFESPRRTEEPDRNPVAALLVWLSRGLGVSPPADEDFIKRVVGLPGEVVEIDRRGRVFIDGRRVDEPYLVGRVPGAWGPERVPEDSLFVLGDNRGNSNDSRFGTLGYIPEERVVGRAFIRIWPPSRMGWLRGAQATLAATSGSSAVKASA